MNMITYTINKHEKYCRIQEIHPILDFFLHFSIASHPRDRDMNLQETMAPKAR
jgi:hypothetical protein